MSFGRHFTERAAAAKLGLNRVYRSLLRPASIPVSSKYKIFKAVSRAVLCYAAQVTGFTPSNSLEQVQRHFLKMIFGIPRSTPNYFIYLETGVEPIFVYTLELASKYVRKALRMPDRRLPFIVAREVAQKKVYWYGSLVELAARHGCEFDGDPEDLGTWSRQMLDLVEKVRSSWIEDMKASAMQSRNLLYPQLSFEACPAKLSGNDWNFPLWVLRWVLRLRGSLLCLNDGIYLRSDCFRRECSMCNQGANEDIVHFFGVCPSLAEFRVRFLSSGVLTIGRMVELLGDPRSWWAVARYGYYAWKYRTFMIQEFNWED